LLPRLLPRIESGSRIWNSSNLSSLFFLLENWNPLARATEWAKEGNQEEGGEGKPAAPATSFLLVSVANRWRLLGRFYF
jgi:hypothetical protein